MDHTAHDLKIIDQNISLFLDPHSKKKQKMREVASENQTIEQRIADKIYEIYRKDLGAEADDPDYLLKFYQMYRGVGDE